MSAKGKEVVEVTVAPTPIQAPIQGLRSVCVFGGSGPGKSGEFERMAKELGVELAKRKINVVYGGGMHDLSGTVALNAATRGSQVLSITLYDFSGINRSKFTIGTEMKVLSLPERIAYMIQNADAFIALPGGLDTLELISSVASWAQLGNHCKPLGLLNVSGFFNGILSFMNHAVNQNLIPETTFHLITSSPNIGQLIDQLLQLAPPPNPNVLQMAWTKKEDRKRKKPETDTDLHL